MFDSASVIVSGSHCSRGEVKGPGLVQHACGAPTSTTASHQ